jgi:hypothetical protein
MYMTTRADLVAALTTARAHVAPGGACLVLPDVVAETYKPSTETGGEDSEDGRGLRYIEWTHPIPPGQTVGDVDFIMALRHKDGRMEVVHDRHTWGLFSRQTWLDAFREAGFEDVSIRPDKFRQDTFLARWPHSV